MPLLLLSGAVFTVACLRAPSPALAGRPGRRSGESLRGLDIVAGYQVSWLLMFADYPRFVRSARGAGIAVFLGLALTALWFMPLGLDRRRRSRNRRIRARWCSRSGIGWWGAVLLALATLTTNFVNIYMSALAFKSLRPAHRRRAAIWLIGGVGAALGLLSNAWIEQFAAFTLLLAGSLVPIGGILLAHYFVLRRPVHVRISTADPGPYGTHRGWSIAGLSAWSRGRRCLLRRRDIGANAAQPRRVDLHVHREVSRCSKTQALHAGRRSRASAAA